MTVGRQQRISSRRVFQVNAVTRRTFAGRIVGRYRRLGPNAWDDYAYEPSDGGAITVLPGLKIQVEKRGAVFRMRHRGQVVAVEWQPAEQRLIEIQNGADARDVFLKRCIRGFGYRPAIGAAATIASKLRD